MYLHEPVHLHTDINLSYYVDELSIQIRHYSFYGYYYFDVLFYIYDIFYCFYYFEYSLLGDLLKEREGEDYSSLPALYLSILVSSNS